MYKYFNFKMMRQFNEKRSLFTEDWITGYQYEQK